MNDPWIVNVSFKAAYFYQICFITSSIAFLGHIWWPMLLLCVTFMTDSFIQMLIIKVLWILCKFFDMKPVSIGYWFLWHFVFLFFYFFFKLYVIGPLCLGLEEIFSYYGVDTMVQIVFWKRRLWLFLEKPMIVLQFLLQIQLSKVLIRLHQEYMLFNWFLILIPSSNRSH